MKYIWIHPIKNDHGLHQVGYSLNHNFLECCLWETNSRPRIPGRLCDITGVEKKISCYRNSVPEQGKSRYPLMMCCRLQKNHESQIESSWWWQRTVLLEQNTFADTSIKTTWSLSSFGKRTCHESQLLVLFRCPSLNFIGCLNWSTLIHEISW